MSGPKRRAAEEPQLTLRAVVTGMVLGALLAPSNIYAGLKIGWAFNMAVTSALLSYGFWHTWAHFTRARPMNLLENNINQVVASAGAMIASAGLVAAVPALTLLTGHAWSWPKLAGWTLSVSLIGIAAALLTRHRLLVVESLRFPSGVATATTLQQMYARGKGASQRLAALMAAGLVAGLAKALTHLLSIDSIALPGRVDVAKSSTLGQAGVQHVTLVNLSFGLNPSVLMVGVGVLIGLRAGCSLLLGALIAWGLVGPFVLERGYVSPGAPDASWYVALVEWTLWPGVTLMVSAALTSLAGAWRSMLPRFLRARFGIKTESEDAPSVPRHRERNTVPSALPATYLFVVGAAGLGIMLQVFLFDIRFHIAVLGMGFTFLLATVAARVTGETDITPIGAMGQVTQFVFALLSPGNVTTNLMAANVAGGAASQCADLMQDLRSGEILRASFRRLAIAQTIGVMVGSAAGSGAYLLLVPDPRGMLLTEQWPAPAVATWKSAAEVLSRGLSALPQGTGIAMGVALVLGVGLTLGERRLPERIARLLPSPASMGLAMVVPASYSLSMFLGALGAFAVAKLFPRFAETFLLVIAAGAIAGESLTGVTFAMYDTARGLLGR